MEKPQKKSGVRTALVILCIVLIFIFVAMAGIAIYVTYLYNRMEYVDQHTTLSPEEASSVALQDAETIDPDDEDLLDKDDVEVKDDYVFVEGQGDHIVNIMLVGQDAREGESVQRSDTMMLVTFNLKTRTITLTSLMRDQYVKIPGYGSTKLNHAYQYGGMNLMNETLQNHFGIEVDGNFEVDFTGFEKIIDLLGGVEINGLNEIFARLRFALSRPFREIGNGGNLVGKRNRLHHLTLETVGVDHGGSAPLR